MSRGPLTAVLLVEDNSGDARLLREMLNEQGPEFDTALTHVHSMSDAEKHLAERSVDILLLDLGLPDAQGLEAVRRAHSAAPRLPLVVLTGMDDEALAVQTLQEGAQDYLIKGQIDTRGLLRAMRYAIERKIAELAQSQSEESYRVLFDGNPNPMWVFEVDSKAILAVNSAAVRHYGYSREEFLKMNGNDLQPPEEVDRFLAQFAVVASRSRPLGGGGVFKHRKKSGEVIDVEVAGSLIIFQGRSAMLGMASDVTERNSLQAQLLQPQKMESLGRLAGGVAHDLNNLMGVVLGYGDLTLDKLDRTSPLRLNVERMQNAAGRAVSIVRQLLAFSRKQIQQPRMLSLNVIVKEMEELLHRLIGEDVELLLETEPELGTVKADVGQIEQVIMNLALNARDAMPGGGQLTISTANIELDLGDPRHQSDSSAGSYVALAVKDTGCGMDAVTQARIFEPFFTTKDLSKGTGLGLATVYGIVKQSRGTISVRSEPGYGSTFTICLPRVEGKPQLHSVEKPSAEVLSGIETILLVEDAEPLREVARQFLQHGGYKVLVAEDSMGALAVSRKHGGPIDLLLTDVVMPGLSGPQLAQKMCLTHPGMQVLFMSGYTDEALGQHGVLEEGIALLEKPFTRGSLLRKLREILDPVKSSSQVEAR